MPGVTVSVDIPAPPSEVWADVADIASHREWMTDAESITFLDGPTSGVGTRAEVATRFGPFRTKDVMRFTEWEKDRRMAVHHEGLFTGEGAFTLEPIERGTRFTWSETIRFPWFFGGPFGAWVAQPVFKWVWQRNLRRLAERFSDR